MDFTVIIPPRYASSRLPAKLLEDINGKSLIEHTYLNALQSSAKRVIIATDDKRIYSVGRDFNADVCMTSIDHKSGTSRLSEVVVNLEFDDGIVSNNISGSAVARDLAGVLARSSIIKSVLNNGYFKFKMDQNFNLWISKFE